MRNSQVGLIRWHTLLFTAGLCCFFGLSRLFARRCCAANAWFRVLVCFVAFGTFACWLFWLRRCSFAFFFFSSRFSMVLNWFPFGTWCSLCFLLFGFFPISTSCLRFPATAPSPPFPSPPTLGSSWGILLTLHIPEFPIRVFDVWLYLVSVCLLIILLNWASGKPLGLRNSDPNRTCAKIKNWAWIMVCMRAWLKKMQSGLQNIFTVLSILS